MKKITYTILCGLLVPFISIAQQVQIPAPAKSQFVLEANLPFIFSQINAEQLNVSEVANSMYEELIFRNRNFESDFDITKSGIDNNRKAFLHYVNTDSVSYDVRLVPISNIQMFKKTLDINANTKSVKVDKGTIYTFDRKQVFINNTNDYAILVKPERTYSAFYDEERAERWGIDNDYNNDYFEAAAAVAVDSVAAPYIEEEGDKVIEIINNDNNNNTITMVQVGEDVDAKPATVKTDIGTIEIDNENTGSNKKNNKSKKGGKGVNTKTVSIAPPPPPPPPPVHVNTDDDIEYPLPVVSAVEINNDNYNEYQNKKDSVIGIWTRSFIEQIVDENKDTYSRLALLKDFEKPANNAAVSFYMGNADFNLGNYFSYIFGSRYDNYTDVDIQKGENWLNFSLIANSNDIQIKALTRVTDNMAKSYKNIYKRKINKRFHKYINSNTDIGVMSVAMNTKNYLDEMPNLVKEALKSYRVYEQEGGLIVDLLSVLIDEKAVGKVFWGDAAFVLTNMKEKEYNAIEYKWDDESYESTSEEIVKTDMLPNFLFMMTTKDDSPIRKILNYAVSKGGIEFANDIYYAKEIDGNYDPFEYFLTIKNGIIFISTDLEEITGIRDGQSRGSISKNDKKMIRKNTMSAWFHPNRLIGKLSNDEESAASMERAYKLLNSVGTIQAKSSKMKGNKISADLNITIPNKNSSSLEYLMYLIEDFKNL